MRLKNMRKSWLILPTSLLVTCSTLLIQGNFTKIQAEDRLEFLEKVEPSRSIVAKVPWGEMLENALDSFSRGPRLIEEAPPGQIDNLTPRSADNNAIPDNFFRGANINNIDDSKLLSATSRLRHKYAPNVSNSKLQKITNYLFQYDEVCEGILSCAILIERYHGRGNTLEAEGRKVSYALADLINKGELSGYDLQAAKELYADLYLALNY